MANKRSLPREQAAAYTLAGTGLLAAEYGIPVRLRLDYIDCLVAATNLASLESYLGSHSGARSTSTLVSRYVRALLAGPQARFLRMKTVGIRLRPTPRGRIRQREYNKDWDRAFAITVGFLGELDGGHTAVTFDRLGKQVSALLENPKRRHRLDRLAEYLVEVGEADNDRIANLSAQ